MNIIKGGVTAAKGFKAAGCEAQIKYKNGKKDMALVYSEKPCVTAGTFTTNKVFAAPVKWDRNIVYNEDFAQAVVVNSGVANACTGVEGDNACAEEAKAVAKVLNVPENAVLIGSTGVIEEMALGRATKGGPIKAFGDCMQMRTGKRKAGDGQKREALDSGIAAAARHRVVAEGIDIRLHHHVCDGDDGILNARRQPVTQDLSQHILMETYFFDGNSVHFLRAQQLYDAEQRADALRNSRRRRGGSHAPLENADKEQVQNDVEAGGKNQIV